MNVIGKSSKVRGDIVSAEDLLIDGELDGTIRMTEGRLTIGAEGRVRASIVALEVVIFGRLEGDLHVSGRAELRAGAIVTGNVFAARLSIEDNAVLRGQVDPTRAVEPAAPSTAATKLPVAVQTDLPVSAPRMTDLFDAKQTSATPALVQGSRSPATPATIPIVANIDSKN